MNRQRPMKETEGPMEMNEEYLVLQEMCPVDTLGSCSREIDVRRARISYPRACGVRKLRSATDDPQAQHIYYNKLLKRQRPFPRCSQFRSVSHCLISSAVLLVSSHLILSAIQPSWLPVSQSGSWLDKLDRNVSADHSPPRAVRWMHKTLLCLQCHLP